MSGVHIHDLTALYAHIIEKILRKEAIPSGEEGYYFALSHDLQWWEVLDHVAAALKSRGLITDTTLQTWPDDDAAAEVLGVPKQFVQTLWNSGYVNHTFLAYGSAATCSPPKNKQLLPTTTNSQK